jgi:hypothetical protein
MVGIRVVILIIVTMIVIVTVATVIVICMRLYFLDLTPWIRCTKLHSRHRSRIRFLWF